MGTKPTFNPSPLSNFVSKSLFCSHFSFPHPPLLVPCSPLISKKGTTGAKKAKGLYWQKNNFGRAAPRGGRGGYSGAPLTGMIGGFRGFFWVEEFSGFFWVGEF